MIHELDTVVLSRNIKENGLKKGDIGAVVHCYKNSTAFEVEFVTSGGDTIALLTLTQEDIPPINRREILHVRELASVYLKVLFGKANLNNNSAYSAVP